MSLLETHYDENVFVSCMDWKQSELSLDAILCNNAQFTQKGGYFMRYNQVGIAINPSADFFETFSSLSYHLWHIDAIVVTSFSEEIMACVKKLYRLNKEMNQTLLEKGVEPHIIRYFLHIIHTIMVGFCSYDSNFGLRRNL